MNELIAASLKEGDVQHLIAFPHELMNEKEEEYVGWITEYQRKHKRLPSMSRFSMKFPGFVEISFNEDLPLSDIRDLTMLERKREIVSARLSAVQDKMIEDETFIPTDDLFELTTILGKTQSELAQLSTFDRETYFTRQKGLTTGLKMIDKATGGIHKGEVMMIVARLATGKTTLSQMMMNQWWAAGRRVLCISNESSATEVFLRQDAIIGHFNPIYMRDPDTAKGYREKINVVTHIAKNAEGEIYVPTVRLLSPAKIAAVARHLNVDAIVIDGVYLMHADSPTSAKWERISAVSNSLKQIALELQVPIIGITQLKRMGDKHVIDPEDIAFSDSLGQDADIVLALQQETIESEKFIQAILIKNRGGMVGDDVSTFVKVDFETMTIKETITSIGGEDEHFFNERAKPDPNP